jgi:hypothetical protein
VAHALVLERVVVPGLAANERAVVAELVLDVAHDLERRRERLALLEVERAVVRVAAERAG